MVEQSLYDNLGRVWKTTSLDSGTVRMALDVLSRPVESVDARGARSLTHYDALSRPSLIWAQDDENDALTLRQRLIYGDGGTAEQGASERALAYDTRCLGRLTHHYDEAGQVELPGYDFRGIPLQSRRTPIGDGPLLAVFDNAAANNWAIPRFVVDWTPASGQDYETHAQGLLDSQLTLESSSEVDALRRTKSVQLPDDASGVGTGKQVDFKYSRSGALQSVHLDGVPYLEHMAHNARGQRLLVAYGNGVMSRYVYDEKTFRLSRLRSEAYNSITSAEQVQYTPTASALPIQDLFYRYDLVGNPLEIEDRTPGCGVLNNSDSLLVSDAELSALLVSGDALLRRYSYDALYRLKTATGRQCDNITVPRPWSDDPRCGYGSGTHGTANQDNAPNLTATYTERYTWDAADNLVKLNHTSQGQAWTRETGIGGKTYLQWDDLWKQHADGSDWNSNVCNNTLTHLLDDPSSSIPTHAYDASGNLLNEGLNRQLKWNAAGQLSSYATQTALSEPSVYAIYLYDASGQRLKKLVRYQGGNRVDTTVYLGGAFEHHSRTDGATTTYNNHIHLMDGSQRLASIRLGAAFPDDGGPAIQYHLSDIHNTSQVTLDETGSWCNREEYSPFGESLFGGFAKKRYRFTGKERDEESGFSYHGARYYASWMCRWASADPAGLADGLNRYLYARGSPIRLMDGSGLEGEESQGAGNYQCTVEGMQNPVESNVDAMAQFSKEDWEAIIA